MENVMCGIAGFCNFQQNYLEKQLCWEQILTGMHQTLSHRGNDNCGIFLEKTVGLSHTRLSVRDIEKGCQPMVRRRNGRTCAITYNGEIYNTDELLPPLLKAGYTFDTSSDTEVILYAFMEYGSDFVSRLNGIFSFAIWDSAQNKLFLYRDHAGIKPCFYALQNGTLLFASEPKALFVYPGFSPKINMDSLREILSVGPARTPGCGVFCNVKEVLPGHMLCFSPDHLTEHEYWQLTAAEHTDSYAATVEKTAFLVKDAVTRQMVSDVPVCTFLSGGIDSSIVTSIAASNLAQCGQTLHTFSFDFKENDIYFQSNAFQPERDFPYVKQMVDYCRTRHSFLECDETTLSDMLTASVDAKDLPGMADVDASLLYFCSLAAQHNKVCLTGECADEIFGGYPWFYRPELMNRDGFPWSADISARTCFLDAELCRTLELSEYSHDRYSASIQQVPHLEHETTEEYRRRNIAYLNIKWFMQTLLDRMDRASMYSGLEARVPFADRRIMEYIFNVPWEMKYQNQTEKALLRDACADLLPASLLHRKKSPYPKTYHPGYERLLAERFAAIVNDKNAPIAPLLDVSKAKAFLSAPKELGKPWFGQLMAGPQLIAYFIQINYWMQKYSLSLSMS